MSVPTYPGATGVHRDTHAGTFLRQSFRETVYAGFCRCVIGLSILARLPVDGLDITDPACR